MKYIIYSLVILLSGSLTTFSQAPNWSWAKSAGCVHNDLAEKIVTDQNGSVYVTGSFGSFNSDTIFFGSDTLISAGQSDMFLVKYDPNGNVLWTQHAGGSDYEAGWDIATDDNNNIYITGFFAGDSIIFGSTVLTNLGYDNLFIAKYNNAGNFLWAKTARGDTIHSEFWGRAIITGSSGNVYLTGSFYNGNMILGTDTLINGIGDETMFLVKYDSAGNVLWAKNSISSGGTAGGIDITVDANDNVYVIGSYNTNSISFDSITLNNGGAYDMFIAKYDSSGNVLWAKHQDGGGAAGDGASSIITDSTGNVYVAGNFYSSSIIFGTYILANANGVSNNYDIFIVKYDGSGNVIWAKREGAANGPNGGDMAFNLALDGTNYLYMTGYFGGPYINFGTDTLFGNGTAGGLYIVKYDTSGNPVWAKGADGSDGTQNGNGIAPDLNGNVYVTGIYDGTFLTFGTTILNNVSIPTFSPDMFLAKIGNTTGTTENNDVADPITIYPNPFSEQLNINMTIADHAEIFVFDITSRKLLQQKFTNTVSLNTRQLTKGIYFYEVQNKAGIIGKGKVIKE